ncbi:unnamed protein product [Blepharisma stoltei]|uniref:EF-hand domain-containing protein n=1 Tax=Blepharisma stoltei TaxID=1481888 RepID=A0AAU9JLI6_9CILI|nr:unnamed protein product [Blepharisma stoltei]
MNQGLVGNRAHYRDIFNLFAVQGKITRDKLEEMFQRVRLNPSPEEMEKYIQLVFENRNYATFDDFLKLFKMRCVSHEYTSEEIFKGFLLLSDNERRLHISKIEELIKEQVKDYRERQFLMEHMSHFTDENGWVNYQEFVNSSFY